MSAELLENILQELDFYGIDFYKEYRFDTSSIKPRKFRFDFFIPTNHPIIKGLGIEYDGALWTMGRHQTPLGFFRDTIKTNLAISQGYLVLRYTSEHLKDLGGIEAVKSEILRTIQRINSNRNLIA